MSTLHHQSIQVCLLDYILFSVMFLFVALWMFAMCSGTFRSLFSVRWCWCHQEKCLTSWSYGWKTVTDSPQTGLVLIISSKILPTTALGMTGHGSIASCNQQGQVRAEQGVGASAGVHFLNVQFYGSPTTAGQKTIVSNVMQLWNPYLSLSQSTDSVQHFVIFKCCRIIIKHDEIVRETRQFIA